MRDEDRYKKEHHGLKVGAAILGVFVAIGGVVFKCAQEQQRKDDLETAMRVNQMLADLPPPGGDLPVVPAAPPREPVEFEVKAGDQVMDLVLGEPIALAGGETFTLEATPSWVQDGLGFHVTHARQVSATRGEGPTATVLLAVDGANLQLHTLDGKKGDAELLEALTSGLVGSGAAGAQRPVERTIAGAPRTGIAYDTTTGMVVEAFIVPVGKVKVGAMLYVNTPAADPAPLVAALASLAPGKGKPAPHFEARAAAGAPVPIHVDRAAEIDVGGRVVPITVKRRATVRRTIGTLTFEYPRGMIAAQVPNAVMTMVAVQSEEVTVQLANLGMRFTPEELQMSMLGTTQLRPLGDVERTFGGETVKGRKMALPLGQVEIMTELFLFERGGKHLAALVQYGHESEARAIELSTPIVASVR